MELSLKRDAHFDKITFFAPGRFFNEKSSLKGHQVPGQEVPAGVDQWATGRRVVSGGASGGARGSVRGCLVEGPWAS